MQKNRFARFIISLIIVLCISVSAKAEKLNIFAASSLIDVLQILAKDYETRFEGNEIIIISGSSSILARQIIAGAPADIFISADFYNADLLAKNFALEPKEIFGNRLVILACDDYIGQISLEDLPNKLGKNRLSIGDPNHVPAGIYAKQALEAAGLWGELKDKIAPAGNVRAASSFVVKKASPFAISYATEARFNGLKIVSEIEQKLYSPISYWGLSLDEKNNAALSFFNYLKTENAQEILFQLGFKINQND